MARSAASHPVVVVGAGPYGLSMAAHLRGRGIENRVFGEPMKTWRDHMPYGMYLKSTPRASSISAPTAALTYERYCAEQGRSPSEPLPADDFVEYGLWFQSQAAPHVERQQVLGVDGRDAVFEVHLESGESVTARSVVVASGLLDHVRVPPQLAPLLGSSYVSHSSHHGDLTEFKAKRVAVIGGGQSALESAVLLAEGGADVHLVARRPQILWGGPPVARRGLLERGFKPDSLLGPGWSLFAVSGGAGLVRHLPVRLRRELGQRVLGPSGAWWLRERFNEIAVHPASEILSATPGSDGLVLEVGSRAGTRDVLEVDHVLSATGYEVNVDSVPYLAPALRARIAKVPGTGSPRLNASFESSAAGLYFAGLPALATFGPMLRFVCGTGFASGRVSEALASRR